MRVVLDTNVVASAFLWGGAPERLIELAGILGRSKFARKLRQKNVSGDADLHALGNYRGISVLSPADCLKRVAT